MKLLRYFLVLTSILLFVTPVFQVRALPGNTDGNNASWDPAVGEYHFHDGYPRHLHYDIDGDGALDCPYDFANFSDQHRNSSDNANLPFETFDHPGINDLPTVPTWEPMSTRSTQPSRSSNITQSGSTEDIFLGIGGAFCITAMILSIPTIVSNSQKNRKSKKRPSIPKPTITSPASVPSKPPSPSSTAHSGATAVPPPTQPSKAPSQATPSQKVSRMIWRSADLYIQETGVELSAAQFMYLWSCFFYLLTKIIRDQAFINSVYSHFEEHALLHIRDPEHRSFMVDEMRSSYRYMRSFLIVTNIDPVHSNDYSEFWQTISPIIYGDNTPHELGQRKFASIFKSLMRASLREYQASLIAPAIQFSISSDGDDTAIPELPN